jgi:hypothetical protein
MENQMPNDTSLFLHAVTGDTFPAGDPVGWCLERARTPLLAMARERLLQCVGRTDGDRILNVVLRRCDLNLIELRTDRVTVSYWTRQADLHPLLKAQGFLRPDVQVSLVRRKTGQITITPGDQFLRGEAVGSAFPFPAYRDRWARRHERQPDDATAAPASHTSYRWPGVTERKIPWIVLKAVWLADAVACPNCEVPLLLYRFDWRRSGFLNTHAAAWRACERCRRSFEEPLGYGDPWDWLVARLGPGLLPSSWDGGFGTRDLRSRWPAPPRDLRDLDNLPPDLTLDELVRILM